MRSSLFALRRSQMASGASFKAPLNGNSERIPSLPEASAENRRHIVPSGGNLAMSVQFRPEPLHITVYYHNGRPVEIVQKPRGHRVTVVMVKDLETKMSYVVSWHALVCQPQGRLGQR
jgi:hypothetical protein